MGKRYRVKLSAEEREELKAMVSKGRSAAYKQTHARFLLLSDKAQEGGAMKDEDIARSLQVGRATVERVRRRCVEEGLERALGRKEQLNRRRKRLDGQGEARLIALACGEPPKGRASWTLQLLANGLVEREIVKSISTETVRRTLKKPAQALAEIVLVHPSAGQRRVCLRHGGRAGSLSAPVRGQRGFGLLGREQQAVGERDAPAASGPAWGGGLLRLRILTQRSEQPVQAVCTSGGMAASGGDGPAYQGRLGAGGRATGGRGLPGQRPYRTGDGQSEYSSPPVHCMRPSNLPRPGASRVGWRFTTRPSMAVG